MNKLFHFSDTEALLKSSLSFSFFFDAVRKIKGEIFVNLNEFMRHLNAKFVTKKRPSGEPLAHGVYRAVAVATLVAHLIQRSLIYLLPRKFSAIAIAEFTAWCMSI